MTKKKETYLTSDQTGNAENTITNSWSDMAACYEIETRQQNKGPNETTQHAMTIFVPVNTLEFLQCHSLVITNQT
jgi:hypothetical protein